MLFVHLYCLKKYLISINAPGGFRNCGKISKFAYVEYRRNNFFTSVDTAFQSIKKNVMEFLRYPRRISFIIIFVERECKHHSWRMKCREGETKAAPLSGDYKVLCLGK